MIAEYLPDLDTVGFIDNKNCIIINHNNYREKISKVILGKFINYKNLINNARNLVINNHTSLHRFNQLKGIIDELYSL